MDSEAHQPLEIIIITNKETEEITCEISGTSDDHGKAKAVLQREGELLFYGQFVFKDFFNNSFLCLWEFKGRPDGFHLYRISEERAQPDAASKADLSGAIVNVGCGKYTDKHEIIIS